MTAAKKRTSSSDKVNDSLLLIQEQFCFSTSQMLHNYVTCYLQSLQETNTTKTKRQRSRTQSHKICHAKKFIFVKAAGAGSLRSPLLHPEIRQPTHTAGKSKAVEKALLKMPREVKEPAESILKAAFLCGD